MKLSDISLYEVYRLRNTYHLENINKTIPQGAEVGVISIEEDGILVEADEEYQLTQFFVDPEDLHEG
jgi:hypothetical protein